MKIVNRNEKYGEAKKSYVRGDNGIYYVQAPDDNEWGFSLFSDDQTFPGGFGIGCDEWTSVNQQDVPERDLELLGDLDSY